MAYMTDENGNYKRTVRCGYCYEKGHNKSACPKRKVDLKENVERYTKELAENKFAHDYERSNIERYLRNAKDSLHKMETRGQNRKCGFCGDPGHTRRTCPERKRQATEQLTKTLHVRKRTAERMMAVGFGPGALIRTTSNEKLAVVTEVDFENLAASHAVSQDTYFHGAQLIRFQYLVPKEDSWGGRPTTNGSCYIPMDYLNIDDIPQESWYRNPENRSCELLSSVEVSEDTLLSEASIDAKKVEKWVISNIVDPK